MELLMCTGCGEFVEAYSNDGLPEPTVDECPGCGRTEFKDTTTGEHIDVG